MHDILEKISNFALFGWGVMLKQAMVSGAVNLVFLTILVFFAVKIYRAFSEYMENCSNDDKPMFWVLFGLVYFGLGVPFLYFILIEVLTGFFNPSYWAIAKLLDAAT